MKTRVTTRVVHRRRRRKPSAMKGEKKASAESSTLALVLLRTHVRGRTTSTASRTLPKRRAIRGKFAALISKAPQDVPQKDWRDYLDGFSVEHEGQSTQIRAFMPDQSSRLEAHDLPLEGVSVDTSQSEAFASVIAGEEAAAHITHVIPRTVRITVLGKNELEIEAADRSVTIVSCGGT